MLTFRAHCPRCDGERNCKIHGTVSIPWVEIEDNYKHQGEDRNIFAQCNGCDTVFLQVETWNSENIDRHYDSSTGTFEYSPTIRRHTYPAPQIKEKKAITPDWLWDLARTDEQLFQILNETYKAYESSSLFLSAVGLRTAFDRAAEILKINPGDNFEEKLEALQKNGYIGASERKNLKILTDAGNAAAHRGWTPNHEDFSSLLNTLEQFIERTIISGNKPLEVAKKIPLRPQKIKKNLQP